MQIALSDYAAFVALQDRLPNFVAASSALKRVEGRFFYEFDDSFVEIVIAASEGHDMTLSKPPPLAPD